MRLYFQESLKDKSDKFLAERERKFPVEATIHKIININKTTKWKN